MVDVKKIALFVGGVVFGSAGFKLLSSSDAKKVYTQTTAAVLEQAGDILADAKAINEARAAKAEAAVFEDEAAEAAAAEDAE